MNGTLQRAPPSAQPSRDADRGRSLSCAVTDQRIFGAFVQTADFVAAISPLIDFEKRANQHCRRHVLNGETYGLCGLSKSLVPERLTPRQPPAGREQLCCGIIVKFRHRSGLADQTSSERRYSNDDLNVRSKGTIASPRKTFLF